MRPFFGGLDEPQSVSSESEALSGIAGSNDAASRASSLSGRVAVYDSPAAAPRVDDIVSGEPSSFIESLSTATYTAARECGGVIPFTVIREVVENLIHAEFREAVISVLNGGNTLRITDQGPGIPDKRRAILPGFTTASAPMKRFIRGVGSGLPIVEEFLSHQGGVLELEDNLGSGTVVTLSVSSSCSPDPDPVLHVAETPDLPRLTVRQKRVLSLVMEFGEAGPTLVSRELAVGLSTAHRDLALLEEHGLIESDESGKRILTELGTRYLDSLLK